MLPPPTEASPPLITICHVQTLKGFHKKPSSLPSYKSQKFLNNKHRCNSKKTDNWSVPNVHSSEYIEETQRNASKH